MRKTILIIIASALLPLSLTARAQEDADTPQEVKQTKKSRSSSGIFTGFSGGMLLHGGYLFAKDPRYVFSNTGLGSYEYVKNLPNDGFCMGLGGTLRVHLINHIHLGAEGFVSTMPLMKTGSNVRTGWGGAMCDFYTDWGKVRPLIGLTVGGGTMKRLFVPDQDPVSDPGATPNENTTYNASYTKTPFFLLDPYVGMEIGLTSHIALIIRIDYMLPFGTSKSKLTPNVDWGNFMTPSGPRLYVGLMFGKMKKD